MKKLLVVFAAFSFSLAAVAQGSTKPAPANKMEHKMAKDCCMMKDGKMWVMKDGKMMPMDKDMTMKNGTMVMKDGKVKMKDGKTMMMKNGESIDMDGMMMPMRK